MKKPFSSFNVKKIRINKRILLVLGIIFVVSPGWILGLYWMRYQKLPWESGGKVIQSDNGFQGDQQQEVQSEDLTEEERIALLKKNTIFQEFPGDLTIEVFSVDMISGDTVKSYQFKETYLDIGDKKYILTSHSEFFLDGDEITAEEALVYLQEVKNLDRFFYTIKGRYITTVHFK